MEAKTQILEIIADMLDVEVRDLRPVLREADAFDLAEGLYVYCVQHHGGQTSPEYAALSQLQSDAGFSPGLSCERGELCADAEQVRWLLETRQAVT